jgi:hypothetical protein
MFMESGLEPKKDIFALDNLIAWLEQQPQDQSYEYANPSNCCLAQYFRAQGYKYVTLGNTSYSFGCRKDGSTEQHGSLPQSWTEIAGYWSGKRNHTFGAALKRARAMADSTADAKPGLRDRLVASFAH